ncbi:HdeD family acid-resistance protein [Parafrankia discariae]|uniref:HdeD family acid-resistance protein n=1 Tax=Parafrankia discariae TaxID=365528 RepID=UPI00037FA456|nr:DUF308 domain-containing protein [Parafrankia discariae]
MSASTGAGGPRRERRGGRADPDLPGDFSTRSGGDLPSGREITEHPNAGTNEQTIFADRSRAPERTHQNQPDHPRGDHAHGGRPGAGGKKAIGGPGLAAKAGPALLMLGIGWILFALAIPMFGLTTGNSIANLLGIMLLVAAVSELAAAMTTAADWRPTHALLALLFVIGGIVALAWPAPTLTVVARMVAWYLLVAGIHAIATSFAHRRVGRGGPAFGTAAGNLRGGAPWWAPLAIGAFSIGIAFWAAAHHHPTYSFVVLWVALAALVTGLTKLAAAFHSNDHGEEQEVDSLTESGFSGRATAESARSQARGDARVRGGT